MNKLRELIAQAADSDNWQVPFVPTKEDIRAMIGPGPWHGRSGAIYLIHSPSTNLYKIGVTTNLKNRLGQLERIQREQLELIHWFTHIDARNAEQELHHHFDNQRVMGEWFRFTRKNLWEFYDLAGICKWQSSMHIIYRGK